MTVMSTTWNITGGMDVVGADDEKVGDVADVQGDYIVVSKGFFFPTDYYIPLSAVTSVTDKVYLNVTKGEALNQDWGTVPDFGTTGTTGVFEDRPYGTDQTTTAQGGYGVDTPVDAGHVHDGTEHAPFDHAATTPHADHDETIDVALKDEELRAGTRAVERGQAQVEKVVTEEQQTIEVPVTEEHLTVTRRAATDADVDVESALEEGTLTVPLRGEDVVADKKARVREVVEIGKEAVTHTEQVTGTVRSEDVRVREDANNVIGDVAPRDRR